MLESLGLLLSAFGAGNISGAVVTHLLNRRAGDRKRRIETDKAMYSRRSTVLISTTLAALIRTERCRDHDREALAEVIQNLEAGEHRNDFLDPSVRRAWRKFLSKSAECGWKRLAGTITDPEVCAYNLARDEWEHAARKSFGPLPDRPEPPVIRNASRGLEPLGDGSVRAA